MHAEDLKLRILIVDDDEDDYFIVNEYIKNIPGATFITHWCYRYQEALELICERKFDLYLVDYYLGHKTGLNLLKEAVERNCEEPIILLTGNGNQNIDLSAMKAGAVDYLVKGELDTEKLERCIRYSIERAKAMKALRANERKFRNIFERSTDAVFLADENLVFMDVNEAVSHMFGYSKVELLKLSLHSLIVNSNNKSNLERLLELNSDIEDKEVEFITKKNEIKYCMISLSKETDNEGKRYLQGIIHNISNLKKAEKATIQMEKLGMADRLVGTLAHEVRNPLSNINLSLEQLKAETNSEESSVYLEIIGRNSKRIGDLISELLITSRPAEIILKQSILQSVIDESIIAADDRITLKRIELIKNYPDKAIIILADAEKLKIAFLNIIINAIEAMEEGKGKLSIMIKDNEEEQLILISDNGCGINKENLPRLFEPYFTAKRNGMGLGLASTLNILQSHKAYVDVQSKINEGTTFVITFRKPQLSNT